jgi:hypothetical protein
MTFGTICPCPAPSLLELQRERRETTELGYPGRCRWQPPETHEPCFGPPVAKSLVYGLGPGSLWGDRASSPPRFNIYSRGSTHLGAARPAPRFEKVSPEFEGPKTIQDLDRRTNGQTEIWVSRPRQTDRRTNGDLGFRTSTNGQTRSGFQDLDRRDLGFKTSTDGQTRSGFQDLNGQTNRQTCWIN